eukprot:GHVQ01015611.1.p1 GENE.GHVQ01015611.1~~GHVQ01015611.1.p1  ORF type:complete len:570 (+),score=35.44 GHVQ01015611.1:1204-2913(+)
MINFSEWLQSPQSAHFRHKVVVLQGSTLDSNDLQRISAESAGAVFVLPNIYSTAVLQEDWENILRILSLRVACPDVKIYCLLHKAENRYLLRTAGLKRDEIVCADEFKQMVMGKSCIIPGFSALICNLFKSIADCDVSSFEGPPWLQEYDAGMKNEVYEMRLSSAYAGWHFSDVVWDVLERSSVNSPVYLIGITHEEQGVLLNPGPQFVVRAEGACGVFIASDATAVIQKSDGRDAEKPVLRSLTTDLWESSDCEPAIHTIGQTPKEPTQEMLAGGEYILYCTDEPRQRAGARLQYFIKPLRTGNIRPKVVVLSQEIPDDWYQVQEDKDVFFIKGSSLSLVDLEKAGFRNAKAIVVQMTGRWESVDPFMIDAPTIFAVRLIEANLSANRHIPVLAELVYDLNYQIIPLNVQKYRLDYPLHQAVSVRHRGRRKSSSYELYRQHSVRAEDVQDPLWNSAFRNKNYNVVSTEAESAVVPQTKSRPKLLTSVTTLRSPEKAHEPSQGHGTMLGGWRTLVASGVGGVRKAFQETMAPRSSVTLEPYGWVLSVVSKAMSSHTTCCLAEHEITRKR